MTAFLLRHWGAVVASLVACVCAVALLSERTESAALSRRVEAAELRLKFQNEQITLNAQLAEQRQQQAAQAVAQAREQGAVERARAEAYLNLPVPAEADRCEAARQLVDRAVEQRWDGIAD